MGIHKELDDIKEIAKGIFREWWWLYLLLYAVYIPLLICLYIVLPK